MEIKYAISVIIPVFNGEKFLKTCLDSLEKQTFKNFEVIIINDGSIDRTKEILNNIKNKKYSIFHQKNKGQGFSRNFALTKANSEYIMFLDSDDFIKEDYLEKMYKRIQKDKSDFVVSDWFFVNNGIKQIKKRTKIKFGILDDPKKISVLYDVKHYFTVNKLYRKDFLIDNRIKYGEGYIYEDIEFYVACLSNAKKISYVRTSYFVRLNSESTTASDRNTQKHLKAFILAVFETKKYFKANYKYDQSFLFKYFLHRFIKYSRTRSNNKKMKFIYSDFVFALYQYDSCFAIDPSLRFIDKVVFCLYKRKILNSFFIMMYRKVI